MCDEQQVCRQFEMLVQSQAPSVFMHMLRFGVQPLKIAFPWLMFGFSGTLDVCEVMHVIERHTSHIAQHQHTSGHTSLVSRCSRFCSCGIVSLLMILCCLFQCLLLPYSCSGRKLRAPHSQPSAVTLRTSIPHVIRDTSHRSKAILDSSSEDMINEVFEDLTRIRFRTVCLLRLRAGVR
jgi:hypothetical protein